LAYAVNDTLASLTGRQQRPDFGPTSCFAALLVRHWPFLSHTEEKQQNGPVCPAVPSIARPVMPKVD
tara:strand:+ start:4742 stop:4942 length:201 start_codon:yes stop_codon:yes gene_type:complete